MFEVTPGSAEEEQAAVAAIVRWRREHQPGGSNAGSVFTNPEGDSAGRLIEDGGPEGLPARVGARVGEARQLHPGGQGGPGGRRPGADGPRAGRWSPSAAVSRFGPRSASWASTTRETGAVPRDSRTETAGEPGRRADDHEPASRRHRRARPGRARDGAEGLRPGRLRGRLRTRRTGRGADGIDPAHLGPPHGRHPPAGSAPPRDHPRGGARGRGGARRRLVRPPLAVVLRPGGDGRREAVHESAAQV